MFKEFLGLSINDMLMDSFFEMLESSDTSASFIKHWRYSALTYNNTDIILHYDSNFLKYSITMWGPREEILFISDYVYFLKWICSENRDNYRVVPNNHCIPVVDPQLLREDWLRFKEKASLLRERQCLIDIERAKRRAKLKLFLKKRAESIKPYSLFKQDPSVE